jgi:RNA polymerase sigma factor (sigma-70 family)
MVDVTAAVAQAHRREWAYVLAATVRLTRNLDLAEECVQDAYSRALTDWPRSGIPSNPAAWLTTDAHRLALDVLRREMTLRRALPLLVEDEVGSDTAELALDAIEVARSIPDDRLRLICTCCHPALAREAQVALTLRLMCGVTTAEVARAFLVSESTMAARITRAKKKIAIARIPYRVPSAAELPERVDAICAVLHLLFTTGHTAPSGDALVRNDLCDRAVQLARMMAALTPDNPTVQGVLALMLLTDARRSARTAPDGRMLTLAEQNRDDWDRDAIAEGVALVRSALPHVDRYTLQAAIAAVHAESPSFDETDWVEVTGLYELLIRVWPSPVVHLNHAIAVGFAHGAARSRPTRRVGRGTSAGGLRLLRGVAGALPVRTRARRRIADGVSNRAASHGERGRTAVPARQARRYLVLP